MDKVKLIALIASLYAQEINVRAETVKNAAKENNVKEGELFKLLKEAGYKPEAPKGTAAPNEADIQQQQKKAEGPKQSVVLRHKTEYPRYRRAGLVLTQKAKTYEVTEEQFAACKKDPWIVVGDEKKEGAGK